MFGILNLFSDSVHLTQLRVDSFSKTSSISFLFHWKFAIYFSNKQNNITLDFICLQHPCGWCRVWRVLPPSCLYWISSRFPSFLPPPRNMTIDRLAMIIALGCVYDYHHIQGINNSWNRLHQILTRIKCLLKIVCAKSFHRRCNRSQTHNILCKLWHKSKEMTYISIELTQIANSFMNDTSSLLYIHTINRCAACGFVSCACEVASATVVSSEVLFFLSSRYMYGHMYVCIHWSGVH